MKSFAVLILGVMPGLVIAAPPVIGTATATGAFRLNGDTVMANGTLTEGAVLETGRGYSSVRLTGGARLSLSADSRGKLYSDRIILEKGEARLIETRAENGAVPRRVSRRGTRVDDPSGSGNFDGPDRAAGEQPRACGRADRRVPCSKRARRAGGECGGRLGFGV